MIKVVLKHIKEIRYVVWEVTDYDIDKDDEVTIARFKDAEKAARFALDNRCMSCQMRLVSEEGWRAAR